MARSSVSRRAFLRSATSLATAACIAPTLAAERPPNILFILADDLGFADLSVQGRRDYRTANLDRLANQGVRFTQAYSNSAVCSATRFGLITGRYQYRLRGGLEEPITGANRMAGLPPTHPTLPSLLKRAGYATALIGKWHLGQLPSFGPLKSGYDEFFGNLGGAVDYFSHRSPGDAQQGAMDLYEGEVPVEKTGYYTQLLADRAIDFIGKRRDAPFFLSLHFTAPHWPWEGPGDAAVSRQLKDLFHYDGGSLATYAAMMLALDESVGRVLTALASRNIDDETIVIFTSDNGGERFSDTWPFSGQKSELLEGGIRVPAFIRWPARLRPAVSDQVCITMDWLPTLLAAAGAAPDPEFPSDGENLLRILTGDRANIERTLFWRYKLHEQRAVRSGNAKYLRIAGNEYLFDVVNDPRERANLALQRPDEFKALRQRWETWNAQMLPLTPEVNTSGPSSAAQADRYFVPAVRRPTPAAPR
jgi:arylsulfatase A-like enzyme